jgi:phosphoribosyl 1,2-cyclic phosphodiesterase
VEVTFFGTRGSCPCSGDAYSVFGGSTSCVLVDVGDEEPIILDAGTGLRSLGASLRPALIERGRPLHARILLTHLHYDHLLGLPFFSPLEDPGALVELFGPDQGEATLSEVINAAVTPPFFPVQIKEFGCEVRLIEVGEEPFDAGNAVVSPRWVPHTGATLGFRVESGGHSLAYLPDHQAPLDRTGVAESVLDLCRDVDVAILDAQYDEEEFARKSDWGHSTVAYAVHCAATAGAKSLVLFHHDPAHDDARLEQLEAAAQSMPGAERLERIVAAREGMTIDLAS